MSCDVDCFAMSKLIGDRKFYKAILAIAVPIMVQNGITNFVNLLDNVMVGRIGTEEMSGVSIVNQLIFVYNLCIFGGFSGAGIFTAQYFGSSDDDGIRNTCRFKIILGIVLSVLAFIIFFSFGDKLISLYLNEGSEGNLEKTLQYGLDYLRVSVWGLPAFMIVQAYGSTLRECSETVVPMKAGIAAVVINLGFNWLLIFGNLGFPALGVRGAAIATVLSRIAEAAIVVVWTYRHSSQFPFASGLLKTFRVPKTVTDKIVKIGSPLLLNEAMWSAGMATLTQCYSTRGLDSVAGFNISNTVVQVFKVVFLAFGNTVGIVVGRLLGSGKMDEAVDTDRKLIAFSVFVCLFISGFMFLIAPLFPALYNTNDNARLIACRAIMVAAAFMPLDAFKNATYFTLRSGGRTWITFFFDGGFIWAVSVPIAFLLSRFTALTSVQIFACVYVGDLIKIVAGYILVKKKVWLNNIVV